MPSKARAKYIEELSENVKHTVDLGDVLLTVSHFRTLDKTVDHQLVEGVAGRSVIYRPYPELKCGEEKCESFKKI